MWGDGFDPWEYQTASVGSLRVTTNGCGEGRLWVTERRCVGTVRYVHRMSWRGAESIKTGDDNMDNTKIPGNLK